MRRKRPDERTVAASLSPDTLRPCPDWQAVDGIDEQTRVLDEWVDEMQAWVARRDNYAEMFGWPGGISAQKNEEHRTHPFPDYPFNPNSI
ncbi:hypothetical protein [Microbacterium sp. P02]|uniref:hypothetical protein n=1 Tax=Microbacterium sp. P02 TaxID=3366260 RepID=UPI00366AD479